MIFLPRRPRSHSVETSRSTMTLGHGPQAIVDILDLVTTVDDGDHLQCVVYLAQEFGLLLEPHFLFGTIHTPLPRPRSVLLEGHFYALLRDGLVDSDASGHLRPRRDLFPLPSGALVGRRLRAVNDLSAQETVLFASAVHHLATHGCHAGSPRHDRSFDQVLHDLARNALAAPTNPDLDLSAISRARQLLMPAQPLPLIPV